MLLLSGPAGDALAEHDPGTREEEIWHVHHTVEATVVDNYARVNVGVEIVNEGPDPEFPFRVEVPEDAYVTGLTLTRDGETYEATIEPAQQAREPYEEAKREHRSAGLVERTAEDGVYAYDVNVEGTETVTAVLTYERYLTADAGAYELDLQAPATQRGVDEGVVFDVEVRHRAGLGHVQATPDAEVNRSASTVQVSRSLEPRGHGQASQLRVTYELAGTDPGGELATSVEDGTGYFAHRFRAEDARQRVPLDLSLVLDRSGSMQGAKIDQMRQATQRLVDALNGSDRLHLTFFSSATDRPWNGLAPVDANRSQQAQRALAETEASGSTNIGAAIADGFAPLAESRPEALPVLVFLTDGRPTRGIHDPDRLRTKALEANDAGGHVFGLAFGEDADWGLVHGLARDGDGVARRIAADADAELNLRSFLTALTSPVLTDVGVSYEQASLERWRVGAPVLFAGGELLYVGTFDPNATRLDARVDARGPQGSHVWNVSEPVDDEGPAHLADLVAYQRIRALEARIDAEDGNETLEDRVRQLALEHGFVTEQTSLVVDLPHRDERQRPVAEDTSQAPAGDAVDGAQPSDGATGGSTQPTSREAEHTGQHEAAETPAVGVVGSLVASIAVAVGLSRRS
jgi:Mg-chelatase subunit ChlD